jgi:2'-5' RNA ligase
VPPTLSAVLVAVPGADDVVGRFRARLDRSAAWGVPAHVTVLFPFVPPDRLGPAVLDRLAAAVGSVPAFDVTFARLRWFGADLLWLAPERDHPFRALTAAVWREFPDHPPYGGSHDDPTPHVTVGNDAPVQVLQAAADAIQPRLPVRERITNVRLMQGAPAAGTWHVVAELPLAAVGGSGC